jgi:hypothetical protein
MTTTGTSVGRDERFPRVPVLVAGPLLGVLVGAGLAACGGPAEAGAGDVVPGRASVEVIGDFGFVLIPTGRLDLVIGQPTTDDVGPDAAEDDETHAAPEGGSWVPVHVEHDPFGEGGVPIGLIGTAPQPAALALVVDGTTIDLGAPYRVVGDQGTVDSGLDTVWVAVDEAPDEIESLQLAVTYDGLTQTLDPSMGERDAGAAAALYDDPLPEVETSCPTQGFASDSESVRLDLACSVSPPQRTPYLPGAGWVDDGRSWLVTGMAVSVDSVVVDGTSYDVETIEPTVTVDGSPPLPPDGRLGGRLGQVDHTPDRVAATWAFEASAEGPGQLGITLDLLLHKGDADDPGPGVRELTVTQTVELPAAQLAGGG